jgi:hypothetical protein
MTDAVKEAMRHVKDCIRELKAENREVPISLNRAAHALHYAIHGDTEAVSPEPKRSFYGAECPHYPACNGGCGLGCTHEIEARAELIKAPLPVGVPDTAENRARIQRDLTNPAFSNDADANQ